MLNGGDREAKNIVKMKTFRMVRMALMAVLMCVGFSSCSEDEEFTNGENGITGKRLTRISYSANSYTSFTYDNKKRLIEAKDISKSEWYWRETMIWGDDAVRINSTEIYEGEEYNGSDTYPIMNGLIRDYDEYIYVYNQSDRLIKWGTEYNTTSIIWDGDKLVSVTKNIGDNYRKEIILTYKESCQKGYFPLLGYIIDVNQGLDIFFAHPELLGLRTTQLPESVTTIHSDKSQSTDTYSYEFDNEGYISKITERTSNGKTYTYTLTWE